MKRSTYCSECARLMRDLTTARTLRDGIVKSVRTSSHGKRVSVVQAVPATDAVEERLHDARRAWAVHKIEAHKG
jgi:hypothetical protein